MEKISQGSYRKDIDGLRAIAVLSVILYHFGYLPNGYLGVDVFFTISGYLITKILYEESLENRFSVVNFYLRRIRRIIPLVLFVSFTALLIGVFVMLPDDLENLCQSVIATNYFSNNILLKITTVNYWNIANEYKPLMHTWSLGVEEQFYLIYPFLFLLFTGKKQKYILPVLILLTTLSFCLVLLSSDNAAKFYFIQFRFYELSLGGLGAVLFHRKIVSNRYQWIFLLILLTAMIFAINLPSEIKLLFVVLASTGILVTTQKDKISSFFLTNRLMMGIGKISFSLYMWHQAVLAVTRYVVENSYTIVEAIPVFILIVILSVLSYFIIEQPFRNKRKVTTVVLLSSTAIVGLASTCFSLYLYSIDGVIRDVPEMDQFHSKKNMKILATGETNIMYNSRIYEMNRPFSANDKIKILIIGDSFARDWANILLASQYANHIEISYVTYPDSTLDMNNRFGQAKYIFFSDFSKESLKSISKTYHVDTSKVWNVGTKNFGIHNGVFYNKRYTDNYYLQRTAIDEKFLQRNRRLKQEWGTKYIDLISMVLDKNGEMPVFTPQHKFISEDTHHLTINGAAYFAQLLVLDPDFKIE